MRGLSKVFSADQYSDCTTWAGSQAAPLLPTALLSLCVGLVQTNIYRVPVVFVPTITKVDHSHLWHSRGFLLSDWKSVNSLNRSCRGVGVDTLAEVTRLSHVIVFVKWLHRHARGSTDLAKLEHWVQLGDPACGVWFFAAAEKGQKVTAATHSSIWRNTGLCVMEPVKGLLCCLALYCEQPADGGSTRIGTGNERKDHRPQGRRAGPLLLPRQGQTTRL